MNSTEDIAAIKKYIKEHSLGVLSTVNEEGMPFGAAVYFGVDEELNLYFITKSQTQKNQNIVLNPRVGITFSNEGKQTVLQSNGVAEALKSGEERDVAVKSLSEINRVSNEWLPPLPKVDAGYYVVYRIALRYARISDYSNRKLGEGAVICEYSSE